MSAASLELIAKTPASIFWSCSCSVWYSYCSPLQPVTEPPKSSMNTEPGPMSHLDAPTIILQTYQYCCTSSHHNYL